MLPRISNQKPAPGTDINQCHSYLLCQAHERARHRLSSLRPGPALTISSQTGAGEYEVASFLAGYLQTREPVEAPPWTVFDRQLVEKVLKDYEFPEAMAKFVPEDHRSFVEEEVADLIGLRPPAWVLVPKIAEAILHLANAGHVILIGRGAVFITGRMPNAFHVRLVAPLSDRIERIRKLERLSARAAGKFIAKSDRGRSRYAKAYFHGRTDDDVLYHLVINTGRIPCRETAQLISEEANKYFHFIEKNDRNDKM